MESQSTVFSISRAMAQRNSKDDLSEIRFVFGMQVSPLWWYYRHKYCENLFLELAK
jgi:hypothetical protein